MLTPYAKLRGMKVVFTHHGPDYDRDKWGWAAKTMLKLGERMGCLFADDVIVISNVIKNLIARKYGRTSRVHLIYNGVPEPERCDYPEYFAELGIEKGQYILGMCRFVPEKNLHHLVEACSRIDMKGCKLVLAGDTDFEDDYSRGLKEMARQHGVVLTGFVKGRKLHSLLTGCRCFCLPSSHEGLPIALLEAMSYSVPVIVSDIPANLEVGLDADCYFPVGDVAALGDRLQEMIDSGVQRVTYDLTKYDWNHIAEQVFAMPAEYMIVEMSEQDGAFLLSEILQAGNFGQYDPRMNNLEVRKGKTAYQLHRAWRRFVRNLRFFTSYPEEVLWEPVARVEHLWWRKLRLWRF